MKSKWAFIGLILSGVGALASVVGGLVANKQMEEAVEEAVEKRLNPPKNEEEEES